MVTGDPGTPEDGHWELNIATVGSRTFERREVSAPDVDINYGWGTHVQLKLDIPWVYARDSGQPWKSGLGASSIGIKWRFVDAEDAGYSISIYPQLTRNWLSSSARRGITEAGQEFFLPVEAATTVNKFKIVAEVGRNYVENGESEWVAGVLAAHSCGKDLECMDEVHVTSSPNTIQTLVNFGLHWKLSESLILLTAAGHDFGSRNYDHDDQRSLLYCFGLQVLH